MSLLARILEQKRVDVARRKAALPLSRLQWRVTPTTRRFAAVLRRPGPRFILECKHASPSQGLLRADFDPVAIAGAYADVADAISVLTDTAFFQGSLAHLAAVRARVDQPILCKDFVLEPYQVLEARAAGADAVLLMLSVLDDAAWRECADAASALGMDVLTEVHDEAELDRALALGAVTIGINNRNLDSLRVDLATTARLAPRIPRERGIVCESGIAGRADIGPLAGSVDAFLVGSRLMQAVRVDLAARELVHGRVKVCGLTDAGQARAAWRAGASLGGVIFAPASPRRVDEGTAAAIAAASPLPLVGVFAGDDNPRIAALARRLALHAVQLHGDESPGQVRALRALLPAGCEIWKVLHPRECIPAAREWAADRLLLDGPHGGSGQPFDWRLLEDCHERDRLVLGGGVSAANARAAQALGCHALDVNSGVESAPGIKDPARLDAFFATLRGAA
jgi:indole-3-glycerol phosphate synthase/phosphoribosylanthranilate isomerase